MSLEAESLSCDVGDACNFLVDDGLLAGAAYATLADVKFPELHVWTALCFAGGRRQPVFKVQRGRLFGV